MVAMMEDSQQQNNGLNGIHKAAYDGKLDEVKEYIQNGVGVNDKYGNGWTPLHLVAAKGYVDVAEFLISQGADVNIESLGGDTPLHVAAETGQAQMADLLVRNKANVNCRDDIGNTPLHNAIREKHVEVVEILASIADLNCGGDHSLTPLHLAVDTHQVQVIEMLISEGADVESKTKGVKSTPMHLAAVSGYEEVVQLLASKGARVDCKDVDRMRPIDLATANGFTSMARFIQQRTKDTKKMETILQKNLKTAIKEQGKEKVRFIKILLTGAGAAGKTSFGNLLMKKKINKVHHSTNIVQANHVIQLKKVVVLESRQSEDQTVIWLEMDYDVEVTNLRQILLSQAHLEERKPLPSNRSKQIQASNAIPFKQQAGSFLASKGQAVNKWFSSMFSSHKVKSDKLKSFNSLVHDGIEAKSSLSALNDLEGAYYSGEVLNMITLLDTGGQPEYIHLLPTVNVNPMINFVVHDLCKSLEEQVLVEYSAHGEHIFEPYHLKYSNLDLIKFLMSTINDSLERPSCQVPQLLTVPGKNKNSYLCCIGTHADQTSQETIQNVDSRLTAMVERLDGKAAVWQNAKGGVLFPVDNTTAGDYDKEDPIAKFIRCKIELLASHRDIYELPISWMLLELEIRQVCSKSGRAYISLQECYSIALNSGLITELEQVKSALTYYHLLGVLLYFTEVSGLCDYIIIDHQWFFDRLSSIISFCFKQSSNFHAAHKLKYHGILSKELLQELAWEEEIKEEYFISLLTQMKIIAPIPRRDDGEDFFIPYVLPTFVEQSQNGDVLSQYGHLQGEPLLVQFVSNLLPRGFFCCLVVQILQQSPSGWSPVLSQKTACHTYSNLMTFHLPGANYLSLLDKFSYLEIQIRHPKHNHFEHYPIHYAVQNVITNILCTVCELLGFDHARLQYGFHCHCEAIGEKHLAVLPKLKPPFEYALCRHGSIVPTELSPKHTVWLTEEAIPLVEESTSPNQNTHNDLNADQQLQYKVFTDYYGKLVDSIPAAELSHYFVSDKIISLSDYEEIIRSPSSQKAAQLLLDKVGEELQNGNSSVLNKMLLTIEHHGIGAAKALSSEIKNLLPPGSCGELVVNNDNQGYISAEYEVFIQYYSQIVSTLSTNTLSPHFVAQKIISPDEQLEIFSTTSAKKAAGLLLGKISVALKVGSSEGFYKLLDITEQHGSIDSKNVSLAVRKKLSELKTSLEEPAE